jgi:VanZ family protein
MRHRWLWLAGGWAIAAAIAWLSLTPSPPKVDLEQGDKLGHFIGYGTLMFWFCQLYIRPGVRAAHAAGFAAMGVVLEFLQGALGYRSFELYDMFANALGVLIGWVAAKPTGGRLFERAEILLSQRER